MYSVCCSPCPGRGVRVGALARRTPPKWDGDLDSTVGKSFTTRPIPPPGPSGTGGAKAGRGLYVARKGGWKGGGWKGAALGSEWAERRPRPAGYYDAGASALAGRCRYGVPLVPQYHILLQVSKCTSNEERLHCLDGFEQPNNVGPHTHAPYLLGNRCVPSLAPPGRRQRARAHPARSRISRRRWSGCGGQARALRTPQATACPKNRLQQGCLWTPLVTATSPPSPVYSRSKIGHRTCSHGWATPPDVRRSHVAWL